MSTVTVGEKQTGSWGQVSLSHNPRQNNPLQPTPHQVQKLRETHCILFQCFVDAAAARVQHIFVLVFRRCCGTGGGDGGEGPQVARAQQDRVLHDGGGGRREATDRPGGGVQTHVSPESAGDGRAGGREQGSRECGCVTWLESVGVAWVQGA